MSCFHRSSTTKKRDTQSGSSLGNSLLASVGVERCTVHKKNTPCYPLFTHSFSLRARHTTSARYLTEVCERLPLRKINFAQSAKLLPQQPAPQPGFRGKFPVTVFFFVMFVSFLFFRSLSFPQGEWKWKSSVGKVASKRKDCDGFFKHKW